MQWCQKVVIGVAWAAAFFACTGSPAEAETLVTYMFSDYASNSESVAPDAGSVAIHVTVGNLTDFVDPGSSNNSGFSSFSDMYFARSNVSPATLEDAVSGNDYISFTMAPDNGYMLDLSQITFQFGATAGGVFYTVNTAVRSSVDGFESNLGFFSDTFLNTGASGSFNQQTVDLSGASFQNLAETVEFRFYFWDNSNDGQNFILRFDEMVVDGSVIPEPSTCALLLGGLGALFWLLRRQSPVNE